MKELCIRCNKPTSYDISTPVTLRLYYIEGSGQLCEKCWREVYGSGVNIRHTSAASTSEGTKAQAGK